MHNGKRRVSIFLGKPEAETNYSDEHIFNPVYTRVDRVISEMPGHDEHGNPTMLYLIKWMSLSYDEVSWETEADVPEEVGGAPPLSRSRCVYLVMGLVLL
jgi:hypothetical protein